MGGRGEYCPVALSAHYIVFLWQMWCTQENSYCVGESDCRLYKPSGGQHLSCQYHIDFGADKVNFIASFHWCNKGTLEKLGHALERQTRQTDHEVTYKNSLSPADGHKHRIQWIAVGLSLCRRWPFFFCSTKLGSGLKSCCFHQAHINMLLSIDSTD